jgi:hypothetical protein
VETQPQPQQQQQQHNSGALRQRFHGPHAGQNSTAGTTMSWCGCHFYPPVLTPLQQMHQPQSTPLLSQYWGRLSQVDTFHRWVVLCTLDQLAKPQGYLYQGGLQRNGKQDQPPSLHPCEGSTQTTCGTPRCAAPQLTLPPDQDTQTSAAHLQYIEVCCHKADHFLNSSSA